MKQYKLRVLGGHHYPLEGTKLTLDDGTKVSSVKKGDVFLSEVDLREQLPNRFELIQEVEYKERGAAPVNSGAPAPLDDEFPEAAKAGLVVKTKKIKGKGERYFVYDTDAPDAPLNDKSLAKEEVNGFVSEYLLKK